MPADRRNNPNKYAKPRNTKGTIKRVLTYVNEKKSKLVLVFVLIIISSLAGVFGTYMLRPIINNLVPLVGTNPGKAELAPFVRMLCLLGAVYLSGVFSNYFAHRIMMYVTNGVLNSVRKELFDKMQDLPISYFDTHTHGELMSRYTNDVDTLRNALNQGCFQIVSTLLSIVSTFIMMLVLSPVMTLIIIGAVILLYLLVYTLGKLSRKYHKIQQKNLGILNGYIEEMAEGTKVVKVFRYEDTAKERFAQYNDNLRKYTVKANISGGIIFPINNNFSYIIYAICAMVGAIRVMNGVMDIGSIASFLQYTRSFFQPITQISQSFTSFFSALAGIERIFDVIDQTPELDDGDVTVARCIRDDNGTIKKVSEGGELYWCIPRTNEDPEYKPIDGMVHLDDVHFSYVPDKEILHGVSFYAKPGQKIALVGSTGAGKTTVTNLVTRFYDIDSGSITVDGIDIRDIRRKDLRSILAMVLQDTHLFTGSVKDNIRYGRLDATDEEVVEAAKMANAHDFISRLPEGYDTMLTADGANLSQGQRQLLAIARAEVADPKILILDEATSSIDTRTEALIEKGMDRLMEGRTTFVIAHRLSTVRNSNAIMVVEHGDIIERGDHDELLSQQGRYYQLYTGQFEMD